MEPDTRVGPALHTVRRWAQRISVDAAAAPVMRQRVLHGGGTASGSGSGICWRQAWIVEDARVGECFLPVVAAVPAVVAGLVVVGRLMGSAAPESWRRRGTRGLVVVEEQGEEEEEGLEGEEEEGEEEEGVPAVPHAVLGRHSARAIALAMLGTLAFALHLVSAGVVGGGGWPGQGWMMLPLIPWLVAASELLWCRPRTVPYPVLAVAVLQLLAEAVVLEWAVRERPSVRPYCMATTLLAAGSVLLVVSMPLRDPRRPSKHISPPGATPTAALRSPEERLSLWQFMSVSWLTPMLDVGRQRQLEEADVWSLPCDFQHRRLHQRFRKLPGPLLPRLITAHAADLLTVAAIGLVGQVLDFAAPVFLQLILTSLDHPDRPKRVALTYAVISLAARLLSAQLDVWQLWFGRRCYERSRGAMITMLYEKTLGRKIAFHPAHAEPKPAANGSDASASASAHAGAGGTSNKSRFATLFRQSQATPPPPAKEPASMGRILNLMRNDVYEVAQRLWEVDAIVRKPIAIVLSVTLVVNYLGWPSLMAVAIVVLAQIVNAILARVLARYEQRRRLASDARLHIVSQFVLAIRHLRWSGWQEEWLSQALAARQKELVLRVVSNACNLAMGFVNTLSYGLVPVAAFFAYTVVAKKELTVDVAFPALQLFAMMTDQLRDLPGLIAALINAWVAAQRIEDFMAEPERLEMATEALIGDRLALDQASFAWPGTSGPVLTEIDLSFPEGITVVVGPVAAGKTALLQALLGELDLLEGQLIRPPEPIGYCSQTPWLQSMSIRDNILFSAPYEHERYRAVLDACALTPDLAEFKAGDRSLIGENGIGLSGGQRARVALARAVYSRTNILLLDDPLAALDQQTAASIVQHCFRGPLLKGRTTVLVTHRTDLVLGIADLLIEVAHGKAKILDRDDAAHAADFAEAEEFQAGDDDDDDDNDDGDDAVEESQAGNDDDDDDVVKRSAAAIPDRFMEDEHRAYGGVKASVYWQYIKAGDVRFWALTVIALVGYRLFALVEAWLIKCWGEAYQTKSPVNVFIYRDDVGYHASNLFDDLPPPERNIEPWLITLTFLAIGQSLSYVASQGMLLLIVYTAAKKMFGAIMDKVAHATFRFYDTTPVGRLMNRMTSDMGVIDGGISQQFSAISWLVISWLSAVVVIASISPAFLLFTLVLAILFVLIFRRFIPTSQNLRRLEMVSLTPLMSNFGELLAGLATVRAFGAQSRFQDRVIRVVDTFQKMDHFYWSAQAWLTYRYDVLAALAQFVLFGLALATNLSPGLTAFALLSASKFVTATHGLCRQYGALQMEFVSVERVLELLHLEQEANGDVRPPAWWPSFGGDVVFRDVVIKHAPHLNPALAGVSFTIRGGSKTAIVGRTGSGKSTLALSLLATLVPETGDILVDGINLAHVDRQLLRTRVTFVAQDPVLFPGTLRMNLDPVGEHSEAECDAVLQRVCARQQWQLDTAIDAGGQNLSQGQRQLVGLARAVLRRSALVILDEATASIDRATARQLHQVVHDDLTASTVITIAHRRDAVRDADHCIVLGHGRILAQAPAGSGRTAPRDPINMTDEIERDPD